MFGVVCSGKPLLITEQVEQTKFAASVPNASSISHITVFLLPDSGFTDASYIGLVYLQLPGSEEYKLLGGLNPNKQSAIFRFNKQNYTSSGQLVIDDMDMGEGGQGAVLNIGISIEPAAKAEMLLQEMKAQETANTTAAATTTATPALVGKKSVSDVARLANNIVTNAYNYLGSFIDDSGKVPMKAFDGWWDKFRLKLQSNPEFVESMQR